MFTEVKINFKIRNAFGSATLFSGGEGDISRGERVIYPKGKWYIERRGGNTYIVDDIAQNTGVRIPTEVKILLHDIRFQQQCLTNYSWESSPFKYRPSGQVITGDLSTTKRGISPKGPF